MRVAVLAIGSRGDVQPYVALGLGLRAAGHDVRLATHEGFRGLVEGSGLAFAPIGGDPQALVASEAGVAWLESGRNPVAFVRRLAPFAREVGLRVAGDVLAAAGDADAIVGSALALAGYHVAEARGVPFLGAFLQPLSPTAAFPTVLAPAGDLGPVGNRLSARLVATAIELPFRGLVNGWRRDALGLPPLRGVDFTARVARERVPTLYGFSPLVVPRPADWPPQLHVCGWWSLPAPQGWAPDGRLAAFLDAGPPPVFVGFGSMRPRDPARAAQVVVEALRRARLRGVIAAGWAELSARGALGDDVLVVGEVPHDRLFPRCAAVVHHGGAGTTGTALRAGVPSFAVPFFADQFFWGARAARLGVGPSPLPARGLEPARLSAAIRTAATNARMRGRARAVGGALAREDGVAAAVAAFTDEVRGPRTGGR